LIAHILQIIVVKKRCKNGFEARSHKKRTRFLFCLRPDLLAFLNALLVRRNGGKCICCTDRRPRLSFGDFFDTVGAKLRDIEVPPPTMLRFVLSLRGGHLCTLQKDGREDMSV